MVRHSVLEREHARSRLIDEAASRVVHFFGSVRVLGASEELEEHWSSGEQAESAHSDQAQPSGPLVRPLPTV